MKKEEEGRKTTNGLSHILKEREKIGGKLDGGKTDGSNSG